MSCNIGDLSYINIRCSEFIHDDEIIVNKKTYKKLKSWFDNGSVKLGDQKQSKESDSK